MAFSDSSHDMLLLCAVFPHTSSVRFTSGHSVITQSPFFVSLLLFIVVSFSHLLTAQSQQQLQQLPPKILSLDADFVSSDNVSLSLSESNIYQLDNQSLENISSGRTGLLVQFLSDVSFNPPVQNQNRPTIVLYASKSNSSIFLNKSSESECASPCFVNDNDTAVDSTAFFSNAFNAFVRLSGLGRSSSTLVFGIINYNSSCSSEEANFRLEGTIRVELVSDADETCPLFPVIQTSSSVSNQLCGNGECNDGQCNCEKEGQPSYYGRMCEHQMFSWPNPPNALPPSKQHPNLTVDAEYLKNDEGELETIALTVPIFQTAVVKIPSSEMQEKFKSFAIVVFVNSNYELKPLFNLVRLTGSQSPKVAGSECSISKVDSMGKPTLSGWTSGEEVYNSPESETSYDYVQIHQANDNEERFVSIYADPGIKTDQNNINFSVAFLLCETDDCPPTRYFNLFPIELMPAIFAFLLLAIAVMLVLLWLDRRHGFTEQDDKLSNAELNRMYPVTYFRIQENFTNSTDGNNNTSNAGADNPQGNGPAVIDGTNDDENRKQCPICICNFEDREEMRVLQCGHEFHAECIDVSCLMVTTQSHTSSLLAPFLLKLTSNCSGLHMRYTCIYLSWLLHAMKIPSHCSLGSLIIVQHVPPVEQTQEGRDCQINDECDAWFYYASALLFKYGAGRVEDVEVCLNLTMKTTMFWHTCKMWGHAEDNSGKDGEVWQGITGVMSSEVAVPRTHPTQYPTQTGQKRKYLYSILNIFLTSRLPCSVTVLSSRTCNKICDRTAQKGIDFRFVGEEG